MRNESQSSFTNRHCMKVSKYGVISGPYVPEFQSECGKIRTNYLKLLIWTLFTQWDVDHLRAKSILWLDDKNLPDYKTTWSTTTDW